MKSKNKLWLLLLYPIFEKQFILLYVIIMKRLSWISSLDKDSSSSTIQNLNKCNTVHGTRILFTNYPNLNNHSSSSKIQQVDEEFFIVNKFNYKNIVCKLSAPNLNKILYRQQQFNNLTKNSSSSAILTSRSSSTNFLLFSRSRI
ncbi:uncharacterized protein OCT59_026753 [Rhizophagus irregularis]|uniref:Uncharacterized protein n=3 Tax=Rhizophagus irregularis TaxID=588596 RepID=A0A916EDT1_9GLOM|nr:hypothetical protein RirG_033940 [Rhizophagus irregularis DAOM 197198w]UZO06431.1 hypothetical protein OCT59_026753 [Rhizophagus irregularis]CAB4491263.1 unnamed protein product [Rhizophagus irregularis]CAB5380314.1 unnamed protein product [Rhizophagus irregularis]